jgi:hypothetical protein
MSVGGREGWSFAEAMNALWTERHVTVLIALNLDLRQNFPRVRLIIPPEKVLPDLERL